MNICIIPCRTGSKRFPGKNFIDFNNNPLWINTLHQCMASEIFDKIIISTDNKLRFVDYCNINFDIKNVSIYQNESLHDDNSNFTDIINYYIDKLNLKNDDTITIATVSMFSDSFDIQKNVSLASKFGKSFPVGVCKSHVEQLMTYDHVFKFNSPHYKLNSNNFKTYYEFTGLYFSVRVDEFKITGMVDNCKSMLVLPWYKYHDVNTKDDHELAKLKYNYWKGL